MVRCCKICNLSKDDDVGGILFKAPQLHKKRSLWRKACGVFLTKNCLVCEKHFHPSDLIGKGKTTKLRDKALPTEFPYIDPQIKSNEELVPEDPSLPPIIKAEPPELILVNQKEPKEPCKDLETFLDVNIKVEPNELLEPLILIHEARFDEENSNAGVSAPEEPTVTEISKGEEKPKSRVCGQIEIIDEKGHDNFKIKCNFCDIEYQISYWAYFIDHIKAEHKKAEPIETSSIPESKILSQCDNDQNGEDSNHEEKVVNEPEVESDSSSVTSKEEGEDNEEEEEEEDEEESKGNDKDYEPKAKKRRKEKEFSTKDDNSRKKEHMIFFDHPQKQCVVDYLELIKSNAILWHRRQSIMKRFDEALSKITSEFNSKWPKYEMTDEQSRNSINRIKDLYQRVSDTTHKRHIKNSTHQKKYPKYFNICAEIEENSKKLTNACDNCRAFFFNEIDLQIHKFKVHRIGELPFKCSHCKYGFSKAEKLAEHVQKHNRVKKFTCEICNRGFFDENKFHIHEATHTNDNKPICEVCGEMFSTHSKYRRHRLHHEPPKEKCDICGKLYYEKWNLSEHVKSHLNKRHYQCDICLKSFNHQNDVTIHKRGVHNVKPQPRKYVWVNKNLIKDHEEADFE